MFPLPCFTSPAIMTSVDRELSLGGTGHRRSGREVSGCSTTTHPSIRLVVFMEVVTSAFSPSLEGIITVIFPNAGCDSIALDVVRSPTGASWSCWTSVPTCSPAKRAG